MFRRESRFGTVASHRVYLLSLEQLVSSLPAFPRLLALSMSAPRPRRHDGVPARAARLLCTTLPFLAALLLVALAPRPTHAQGAPGSDLLVLLAGNDTIAIERFTRSRAGLDVELLIKPASARITLRVDVDAQGRATRLLNDYRAATAAVTSAPAQHAEARFTGDSVIVDISGGGRTATQRFATSPGAVPFINPSFAIVELVIQRARAIGGDSVPVPIWNLQGGQTAYATVVRRGSDSVVVLLSNVPARLAVNAAGDITGGVIPAQGLRLVRVRGGSASASAMSVEKPDYSAPAGAPYTAEEVTVRTPGGHTLAGTLTMPRDRKGKVAAVVTITGSGPEDRDEAIPPLKGYRPFRQIADTLGRHGIAVLRLDDRGHGASTGDHASATSADFADDIRAGLAYLRARPEIDGSRLALVGHSEGGLIAPMVAVSDPSLRGIVLMAGPSQTGRQILRFQLGNAVRRDTSLTPARRDASLATLDASIDSLASTSTWLKYFLDYDPLVTARKVRVPTLILQGATDQQVTAEQAGALEKAMRDGGNRRVAMRVFPEANHLFVQDANGNPAGYTTLPDRFVRADVMAALLDWLRTTLK